MIGALCLSAALVLITGRNLSGGEWAFLLLMTGVGGLAWRTSTPLPASAADLALLSASPAVAKALAREHQARLLLTQGILLGLGIALLLMLVRWASG